MFTLDINKHLFLSHLLLLFAPIFLRLVSNNTTHCLGCLVVFQWVEISSPFSCTACCISGTNYCWKNVFRLCNTIVACFLHIFSYSGLRGMMLFNSYYVEPKSMNTRHSHTHTSAYTLEYVMDCKQMEWVYMQYVNTCFTVTAIK